MTNGKPIDPILDALLKKEAALKTAIAQRKIRQQKKQEKDDARLYSIVGATLIGHGTQSPDFRTMLKQVLASSVTEESSRRLLSNRGWL